MEKVYCNACELRDGNKAHCKAVIEIHHTPWTPEISYASPENNNKENDCPYYVWNEVTAYELPQLTAKREVKNVLPRRLWR